MQVAQRGITILGLAGLLIVGGAICLAQLQLGSDVAAWVQALGSILALGVAVYIPVWIDAKAKAATDRSLAERRAAACEMIEQVVATISTSALYAAGQIGTGGEILGKIDFKDLDVAAAKGLTTLIMHLGAAEAVIAEATGNNPDNCGLGDWHVDRIHQAGEETIGALAALNRSSPSLNPDNSSAAGVGGALAREG